nr:immunoglobulin light chain junction region [Macaca mulatta]MOW14247.1 immunoglobulin light chain junction region [Macaca mulatta]
CQQYNDLFWTF